MEKFYLNSEFAKIGVYSEIDYGLKEKMSELFKEYLEIKNFETENVKLDYSICFFKNNHGINMKEKLDSHNLFISKKQRVLYTTLNYEKDEEIIYVKRIVESLRNRILEEKGVVFLHGACIVVDEYGIAFVGGKYSGKTTTIFNYLLKEKAKFLSNDRIGIVRQGNKTIVIGCPSNIGIRATTINSNVILKGKITNSQKKFDDESRIALSIKELREKFGIKCVSSAELKYIFLLEHNEQEEIKIKKTFKDEFFLKKLEECAQNGVYKRYSILENCIDVKKKKITDKTIENVKVFYFNQYGDCTNKIKRVIGQVKEKEMDI